MTKFPDRFHPLGKSANVKKCHDLKPFRIADFTRSAVLQGTCGSQLQRRPLRLAAPANSTIAQFKKLRNSFSHVPLLGWLLGALIAVVLEYYLGDTLADILRLPKIPVLFGFVIMLKKPLLIPSALVFVLLIYALPISVVARLSATVINRLVAWLFTFPTIISVVIHLGFLYAILHLWWLR